MLIKLRIIHNARLRHQRPATLVILLAELVPRLAVDVADFQRHLAAAKILILHFQAVHGVIHLAVDALAIFRHVRLAVQADAFEQRHLLTFNRDRQFFEAQLLFANALFKAGHLCVAVSFQAVEGELHMLAVFVDGINQTAVRFAFQAHVIAVFVGIKLEITAAERHFLIRGIIVQRLELDIAGGRAAVANTGLHIGERFAFRHIKQRFGGIVVHKRGMHRRHRWQDIELFQIGQRERTVAHYLIQHHALARLQQRFLLARRGFDHQLQMAAEQAALVILVAKLKPGLRRAELKLRVGFGDHFADMFFKLLTGVPRATCPDNPESDNHAHGDQRFFHSSVPLKRSQTAVRLA
ncbi:hypothetical protein BN135_159 [Cronobacter muytjensii 530]